MQKSTASYNDYHTELPKRYNWNDLNRIVFQLKTSKAIFFTHLTVKVYFNRISLEYRPFVGGWEHTETYSAMDVGHILINKGRKRANIVACRINTTEKLFEIKGLYKREAEDLKDALDEVLTFRYINIRY